MQSQVWQNELNAKLLNSNNEHIFFFLNAERARN